MERPSISFFVMLFILLFAVIGFIFVVFDLRSIFFVFQLAILLSFMFFLAFGMFLAYSDKSASWGIIAAVLVLMIFDTFIIMLYTRRFSMSYAAAFLFSLIGLVAALVKVVSGRKPREPSATGAYDKPQYYYPYSENAEQAREELKAEVKHEAKKELKEEVKQEVKSELRREQRVSAAYMPGKYVASKKAETFHTAKCDWAARISKENRIWFDSREEAQSKGFKADKCVV